MTSQHAFLGEGSMDVLGGLADSEYRPAIMVRFFRAQQE